MIKLLVICYEQEMIKQLRKMGIIEMVQWERSTCRDIGGVLIFMFSGVLIAIHSVALLYCLRIHNRYTYQDYFILQGKGFKLKVNEVKMNHLWLIAKQCNIRNQN